MNRICDAFRDKKAFIAYLMAGDPSLEKTGEYILAMQEAGADLIEIGIPFSDPIAEGKVIQRANLRALAEHTTADRLFEMLEGINGKVSVPLVFLTYLNPVIHYGSDRFFRRCRDCGVSGIIIPDMPFEEQAELLDCSEKYGVEIVTLVAPTSDERIERIAKAARGFIYLVSSMGVTGVRSKITTDIPSLVATVKRVSDIPVAVGFGIATPEQAKEYSRVADGVIVGSAIVKIIEEHGGEAAKALDAYVREMKAAVSN